MFHCIDCNVIAYDSRSSAHQLCNTKDLGLGGRSDIFFKYSKCNNEIHLNKLSPEELTNLNEDMKIMLLG